MRELWSIIYVRTDWMKSSLVLIFPFYRNCYLYLIGINLPGRNLPIFEKGGKFLPGNLKHGQVMERMLKMKS